MKNLSAQKALKNPALKKLSQYAVLDVVPHHEFHLIPIDRRTPLEQQSNLILKRSFDLAAASVLIVGLLSWMLPLIALLIKLDSKGPVFFFQKRNKKNGKLFTCIKFRTMVVNDKADTMAALENDARITKTGKFLRKHHLDELPQLLNVWWGDMSIIGPRPYMISDNEKYAPLIKNYLARQKVKPGITGLAQVRDYVNPIVKTENMEARVSKDLYYIYHWSPLLDIKIIMKTVFKMAGIN